MSFSAMSHNLIYLDYQATAPVDERVLHKMIPYFSRGFANPSSSHNFGQEINAKVENARAQIAISIGASSSEIIFTSGATESNHLVFNSLVEFLIAARKTHIIVSAVEHKSVLDLAKNFEKSKFSLTVLPVNRDGLIEVSEFKKEIRPDTGLVSVMAANNEIGAIQPIEEIADICALADIVFHTDAVQALGKYPFDVSRVKCLFASLSSHKVYGPKGIGALYARGSMAKMGLRPMFVGGNQEGGMRSGTLNVPGIIGFAEAVKILMREADENNQKAKFQLRRLWSRLSDALDGITINGGVERRLANNLNICIKGVPSDALIASLPEVAFSNGSACTARAISPSHVLKAIGLSDDDAFSSIRIGVGRMTTDEEIERAADAIIQEASRIRKLS